MSTCPSVPLNLASNYATLLDGKAPAEVTRRGVDWGSWLICNNPGVTLDSSVWAVHSADDDATLTLAQATLTGNVASVAISGGTAGKSYRLTNTAGLSDGQSIVAVVQIPVRDVQAVAA